MTRRLEVTENSKVSLAIKNWWALLVLVFGLGVSITAMQFKTDARIHELYLQNQSAHELLLMKLDGISTEQKLFVLRSQVIEAMTYNRRMFFEDNTKTNLTVEDELSYRQNLENILSGNP